MTEWVTVLDIEKETGIPNASIRRYIRHHGHHMNVRKKGKSYTIAQESIKTMQEIRRLYDDGKSSEQVEEIMIRAGAPVTITVNDDEQMTVSVGEAFQNLQTEIRNLKESHNKQMNELMEKLDQQQEYIEQRLEERDRRLMEVLKESQENRREIAASKEKKKKGWFARLFQR